MRPSRLDRNTALLQTDGMLEATKSRAVTSPEQTLTSRRRAPSDRFAESVGDTQGPL
jgi:hypothetical protein